MKRISILLFTSIIIFAACKRTTTESKIAPERVTWQIQNIATEKNVVLGGDSTQKGMQLKLSFSYPTKFENDSMLQQVQSSFIFAFTGYEHQTDLKEAFETFTKKNIEECIELGQFASKDEPDFSDYFRNISTTVFDTTTVFVTAQTFSDDYTGGAHGSHSTMYYNIDLNTGNILKETNLFKADTDSTLTKLIRAELTDTIKGGASISILDWDSVKPNGNFYFDNKGIIYVYNTYEIAPYSDGLVQVCIPYAKVKDIANDLLNKIIATKTKQE